MSSPYRETTPPPRIALPQPGTPVHSLKHGLSGSEGINRDTYYKRIVKTMPSFFIGPIPADRFLQEFLPVTVESSRFKPNMFNALVNAKEEKDMYSHFVSIATLIQ